MHAPGYYTLNQVEIAIQVYSPTGSAPLNESNNCFSEGSGKWVLVTDPNSFCGY
jgi:hypothetical protein